MSKTKEYLKNSIISDIENLADEPIFEEEDGTPKEQIDEWISLAKENGIDFWAIVKSNCSSYEKERLEYLYEGKDLDELDEKRFGKPEVKPFEEYFPERDGKVLISVQQAIKLKEKIGDVEAKHYYIAHNNNPKPESALLSTKKQKLHIQAQEQLQELNNTSNGKYIFYAAIPRDEMIDLNEL